MGASFGMLIGEEEDWGKDMYAARERVGEGSDAADRRTGGFEEDMNVRNRSRESCSVSDEDILRFISSTNQGLRERFSSDKGRIEY